MFKSSLGILKKFLHLLILLYVNTTPLIEICESHFYFRENWEQLRQQINHRQQRLHAAGEVHRFHRDVADSLSRIHEKNAALGTELGRDLNSALALLRRQEAFENELVVLEAQLQMLIDDAARLQATYPSNKRIIQEKQALVVTEWNNLKEKAEIRRDDLQASVDLQRFLTLVRDLTNWASGLRIAMATQESVKSAVRAQALKTEHEALKGEIEAREESFQAAAEMSTMMEQTSMFLIFLNFQCNSMFGRYNVYFTVGSYLYYSHPYLFMFFLTLKKIILMVLIE